MLNLLLHLYLDIKVPPEEAYSFQAMVPHQGGEVLSEPPKEVTQKIRIACLGGWETRASKIGDIRVC